MCAQACVTGAGPPCDHWLTHAPDCLPARLPTRPGEVIAIFSSLRSFASGGSWDLGILLLELGAGG